MRRLKWFGLTAAVMAAIGLTLTMTGAQEPTSTEKLRGVISDILGRAQKTKPAGERVVPQSRAELQFSYAPLVKLTAPAVVNVYAERMVRTRSPFAGDPFFERFFGQGPRGRSQRQSSLGSGVIVDASGIVVTNNHVIDGADEIKIAFADGREYPSRVLLKDKRVDLAVLKIDGGGPFSAIDYSDSDRLEVGDILLAIGNPFGVGQTVTSGIVSALARNGVGISDFGFFIQTDAAINPGNSGGALVDMNGQLVGINTAIFSRSGGSNGIGFAIPANMVRAVVDAARSGADKFSRPFIGASFVPVTADMAEALGMEQAFGAIVTAVVPEGPAHEGGLKVGDLVISLDGLTVQHPDALGYRLATAGVGKVVKLEVISRSSVRTLSIRLGEPSDPQRPGELRITGQNPFSGAVVVDIDPRIAEQLRLPLNIKGVVVLEVEDGSPANRYGLRPRDILVEINGETMRQASDVAEAIAGEPGFWQFEITRNGRRLRQMVR
ncbi:DegQ family serine endoprotease [Hoeflea prorocentri]|uniref:DegQ family serine endoprotease n=1 Tax=Hoeflea prorocentri TaxID=1922333 RepID=A0A9X3UI38_9HYPH|nr:DegQ family serine endoprotease [Hoeflea prorocentri]MCY6380840.1 DegQ family serine endoprotease [Hoeflea prorocentri]MDA5398640.1 DegQ family serine endoprotease [Hoeflea prorocentri]